MTFNSLTTWQQTCENKTKQKHPLEYDKSSYELNIDNIKELPKYLH